MSATFYAVDGRLKELDMAFAKSRDFGRTSRRTVSARDVLFGSDWSPYCIDADAGELVFVHLPRGTDLSTSPFTFLTQYLAADAIITVPLAEVAALAADLPDPNLVLVFSIGRCGTTLVSHALNGAPSVWSVSEPGVFDHRPLRALAANQDVSGLLRDLTRLVFACRGRPDADTLAVKFRSQAIFTTRLFWQALPRARYVFMYRDALTWAESFYQFISDIGIPLPMDEKARDFNWSMISADMPTSEMARFFDLGERPIDTAKALAPGWSVQLLEYASLLEDGVPFLALRYNELNRSREAELSRLFAHCGLPATGIDRALQAFDIDSQEGTAVGRKGQKLRFDAAGRKAFLATLAREPRFADPNLILPDIYSR